MVSPQFNMGGNNENQCYTNRPENAYVDDSVLKIVAKLGANTGPVFENEPNNIKTQPYKTACLPTLNFIVASYIFNTQ
jgi:hypothetical protein